MSAQQILDSRRAELTRKQNENALLQRQMDDLETRMVSVVEDLAVGQESLAFLEDLANGRRGSMKGRIESIITEAMHLIYDDSYSADLTYTVKNNRSHLAIEMVRKTALGEVRREMGGFGGGMADTMSVPLRLMVLMGTKQTDRVCVLDECWKHMDDGRIELVAKFVRMLADRLDIQVIFASHHSIMRDYADRLYGVTEIDGRSEIEVF